MNTEYPTTDEPATPEYVLAVLRDMHRQQSQLDPVADPDASLTFESTVAEWREACDLVKCLELGRANNRVWGISGSDAEWQSVLEPANEKHLSGVCEFIASHAHRRRVRPAQLLGRSCGPAGAFLTVRSLLHQAGVPVEGISPSTPLAPYTRRHYRLFLGEISRLAPGALPPVGAVWHPIYYAAVLGIVTGCLCLLVGIVIGASSGWHMLTIGGGLLLAGSSALQWIAARRLLPVSVKFGELQTFRDLALAIAEGGAA